MKILNALALVLFFLASCSDKDDCGDVSTSCYSFDVRQCQTDQFADDVSEDDSRQDRESDLHDWLEDQGIDVETVRLELDFHEGVCEACDVCPTGDRYFVEVDEGSDLTPFDLLNLEEGDCCELFN